MILVYGIWTVYTFSSLCKYMIKQYMFLCSSQATLSCNAYLLNVSCPLQFSSLRLTRDIIHDTLLENQAVSVNYPYADGVESNISSREG